TEAFLRDAKVNQIGAGTSEVMRMILYRQGLRAMREDLKFPHRQLHEKLKVPISTTKPARITEVNEQTVLKMLAENYQVNPGLYMSLEDMKERLERVDYEQLNLLLTNLEAKGLAKLYRDRKGNITLARATFEGLRKAKTREAYRWFPDWISREFIF
ncbi:MAG: acyl-CoA dehydrogenase family protein, partial [Candidatus Bathyarchaeales archaeon]